MAKRIMRAFKMNEISAVDRPAQAHARALIMKRDDVQKDMYGVSRFAEVLGSIFYLVQNSETEAQYEGDNSPVPKALREWLKAGTAVFRTMAKEEVDELIASYKKRADDLPLDAEAEEYLKRSFSAGERKTDAKSGAAEKDGSFPIENAKDLKNAMRAVGRSKNPGKTRAHIRARARALGLTSQLSDTFKSDAAQDVVEKFEELLTGISPDEILKLGDSLEQENIVMDDAAIKKAVDDAVAAATAELTKNAAALTRENAILKMAPAHKAYFDGLEGAPADAFVAADGASRAALVEIHAASKKLDPEIQKRLDEAEADRKILKALQEDAEAAKFEKRAIALGLEPVHGAVIRKAYSGDAAAQVEMDKLIKGMAEQIRTGVIFKEFGTSHGADTTSAKSEMDAKVAEVMKAQPKLSKSQAFTKVYTDSANADLKKRFDDEDKAARSKAA